MLQPRQPNLSGPAGVVNAVTQSHGRCASVPHRQVQN